MVLLSRMPYKQHMLFTFTHLVDAFIQSDVHHFHGTHSYQFLLSCELNLGIARANSLLFELQETFKCSILFSMVNNLGLKLVYGCFIVLLIWCFIVHLSCSWLGIGK